jgi:hypothetical protein
VILCEDDLIEWDDDYPPQLGQEEDKAQSRIINLDCFVFIFNINFSI